MTADNADTAVRPRQRPRLAHRPGLHGHGGDLEPRRRRPGEHAAAPSPPSRPRWKPASRSTTTPTSTAARPASPSSRTAWPPCPAAAKRSSSPPKSASGPGYYDHSPDYIRAEHARLAGAPGRGLRGPVPTAPARPAQPPRRDRRSAGRIGARRAWSSTSASPTTTRTRRWRCKKYLKAPIVSNQISISLLRLDPIYEGAAGGRAPSESATSDAGDGVLDQCEELDITPLAYSPLGGGWLSGRREVPADDAHATVRADAGRPARDGPGLRRRDAGPTRRRLAAGAPGEDHPAGRLQQPGAHPRGRRRGGHHAVAHRLVQALGRRARRPCAL